jgi:hypothetical protein
MQMEGDNVRSKSVKGGISAPNTSMVKTEAENFTFYLRHCWKVHI